MLDLVYCAGGNARFAQIAIDAGYKYGARLPATVYHPVYFADQDWHAPDRARYMAALAQPAHRATSINTGKIRMKRRCREGGAGMLGRPGLGRLADKLPLPSAARPMP